MALYPTLHFVPGDDWLQEIVLLDAAGAAIDYSGWTVQSAAVTWTKAELGSTPVIVDMTAASLGRLRLSLQDSATDGPLYGFGGELAVKLVSDAGLETTVYFAEMRARKTLSGQFAQALQPGIQGPAGINWRGDWATGTAYAIRDGVFRDGTSWRCIAAHAAGLSTQPGAGADWETVWAVLALGSDVASVAAVAAIADEVEAVAGIAAAVQAVAAVDDEVGTVAGIAAAVQAVAAVDDELPAVAAVAPAVSSVAGIDEEVVAVAAISADIQTVAARDAAVGVVAARDADIGTVAARDAAIATVAARDADIAIVAARDADIVTVAARDADIGIVAARDADIGIAADNIGAIIDAPNQAAAAAVSAADALTYAGQGDVSRQLSQAERLLAEGAKTGADTTKAAMDVALANVLNYSNTLALLNGAAKEILAAADIVDVFVYDTTLDSDQGAWRSRCRHTSWYNEGAGTHRSARKEFPQKSLFVIRSTTTNGDIAVSGYDLDSVDCPRWMSFTIQSHTAMGNYISPGALTSVRARNGLLVVGDATDGVRIVDFIADTFWLVSSAYRTFFNKRIADRNSNTNTSVNDTTAAFRIASPVVNGIAVTVLPGTPIDPVRGLPTPTIAVATAGGVSVIHLDGRVTTSANTTSAASVEFDADNNLWWPVTGAVMFSPPNEYAVASFAQRYYSTVGRPAISGAPVARGPRGTVVARSTNAGIRLLRHTPASGLALNDQNNRSYLAAVTSTINTGHQLGDIRLALAESSADVTSLVGAAPINVTFSGYADKAAALADGWVEYGGGTFDIVGGNLVFTRTAAATEAVVKTLTGLTIGRTYVPVGGLVSADGGTSRMSVSATADLAAATNIDTTSTAAASVRGSFVATATTMYLGFRRGSNGSATWSSVRADLVAVDRSVAGNHPRVAGTITRAAVETGAEVAYYSGFSENNFLEVANNGQLDFGLGDFSFWCWYRMVGNSGHILRLGTSRPFVYAYISLGNPWWRIYDVNDVNVLLQGAKDTRDGQWHQFVGVVRGRSSLELWLDGALLASSSAISGIGTMSNSPNLCAIGKTFTPGGADPIAGRIALPRLSATAPTPEQIRAIYEEERLLFRANAKCLLPGDNVPATTYDDSTGLLHVATTSGSARMRGLLVVDRDATVYTGIDAKAGIVATRDANSADIVLPSVPLREAALMGHNGGPPLYDRRTSRHAGVTTNATPTVIARLPMDKGETGQWVVRTIAREYASGAQLAAYEDVLLARRPGEGNIVISGSVTQRVIQEVTASMAVGITANTTTQTIDITATGVAATNIEWTVEARLA